MDRSTFLFLNHRVGVDMTNYIYSFVGGPRRAPTRAAAVAGVIRRRAQEEEYSFTSFETLLLDQRDVKKPIIDLTLDVEPTLDEIRSVLYSTVDPSITSAALFGTVDLTIHSSHQDLLFSLEWEMILDDALPPLDARRPRTLEEEECVAEATQMNFERHSFF